MVGRFTHSRLAYILRVLLAVGAMSAWAVQGLLPNWNTWLQALNTPSAAGLSYSEQRSSLEGYDLYTLVIAARDACPPGKPVLALSDDIRADQQGNYYLYPRRVDIVRLSEPFGLPNFTAHAGACFFFYGADAYPRITPFQPQLAKQIICVKNGCLYLIRD